MKQFLTAVGVFVGIFFGLFTVISLLVVTIFPVTWNDVVTCPGWCAIYFFLGLIFSIMGVDAYVNDNKR
jgi:hypothetical protein